MDLIRNANEKGWNLWVLSKNGALPRMGNVGEIMSDAVGKDMRVRIGIHEDRITKELNAQLADNTTTFDARLEHLMGVQKLGKNSDLTWNVKTPYAEAMMKKHLSDKIARSTELGYLRKDLAEARLAIHDRDKLAWLDSMDKDIGELQKLADDQSAKLHMLSENPPDMKIIDGWNAEVSKRVDALRDATEKIGGLKKERAGRLGSVGKVRKERPDDAIMARLYDAQQAVVGKAGELAHAHAQEMSLRASVRSITDNMKTARAEVLAMRKTGTAAEKSLFSTMDHATPSYIRSKDCWIRDVDLTCASPWTAGTLTSGPEPPLPRITLRWQTTPMWQQIPRFGSLLWIIP